jgi:hypothetical protein
MRLTGFHDHDRDVEDDGNLTAESFSIEARWMRLLAAVQLTYHRHAAAPEGDSWNCMCHLCRVYRCDWWD